MKTRIFLRAFNLTVCGLAVAAFAACGGDDDGGGGGSGGAGSAGSTTSSGSVDPSTTTAASTGTTDPTTTSTAASTSASTGSGAGPQTIEMIDDMEDNDNAILAKGGRVGYWYTFNDGSEGATQTPPPDPEGTGEEPFTMTALEPARSQSTYAARSWGEGFETWGAGFGFDLNSPEGAKAAYDASAYTGITFWAKLGPGSGTSVTVLISDPGTDPTGGSCSECDAWQKSLAVTEEWQQFTIPFADLKQGGWGDPAGTDQIDATKLYAIQFQIGIAPKFDLYIDDLGFYN
ncbi:carbohydrate binding domain-containing protein [Sorangium atrum]|uniref:CIA30 family protein n=1 Tax=Sorangium atrum TaxID=2995308 RepID=A0ABT5BVS8_9BACT|nr:carbohydrate binding domain-containing protein [Sorangium aterium]MDC0677680.1 CIA30 family protein [Sorangium aterium]